jgi:hypothetical protein
MKVVLKCNLYRYTAGLKTSGRWATDANGRDMQRRLRNRRDDWDLKAGGGATYKLNAADPQLENRLVTQPSNLRCENLVWKCKV